MRSFALALTLLSAGVVFDLGVNVNRAVAQPNPTPSQPSAKATAGDNSDDQFVALLGKIAANRVARAKQANAQEPGTFTADDLALLEQEQKTTEALGQATHDGKPIDWYAMLLGSAEISKTAADLDLKHVAQLRQQDPKAVSVLDADEAQLRAQLTALNLERGKAAQAKSPDDRQNWALQFLLGEMQALQDQVRGLEERE